MSAGKKSSISEEEKSEERQEIFVERVSSVTESMG